MGKEGLSDSRKRMIFIVIMVTCILCSMLSTALTTALPQMMLEFGISAGEGQWLTSVYSLVMGIMLLATAYLIRRFRTKRLYMVSLALFTLGLFLDGITTSFVTMMVGRIFQAAGNGILLSLGQVVLLTIYPKEKRGSIMGIYGLAVGAAPVIAPTLAGLIIDASGWRMIFYILLVISFVALILTGVSFRDVLDNEKIPFDILSFLLCGVGFGGILLGLGNMGTLPMTSGFVLLPLLCGIAACIAFVWRQLHMETPFLELRILKVREYRIAVAASMVLYAILMALSVLLPIHIQSIGGHSATISGLVIMPGSIAMALINPVAGKMYDKMGMKRVFASGAILMILSGLGFWYACAGDSLSMIAFFNTIRNISTGLLMMPLVTWGMGGLQENATAHGTALLTSLRTVSGSFGVAVFMTLVSGMSASGIDRTGMQAAYIGLVVLGIVELVLCICAFRKK